MILICFYCTRTVNVTLPISTMQNGSLYLHVFLYPHGESAFTGKRSVHQVIPVTEHKIPVSYFSLMGDQRNKSVSKIIYIYKNRHNLRCADHNFPNYYIIKNSMNYDVKNDALEVDVIRSSF